MPDTPYMNGVRKANSYIKKLLKKKPLSEVRSIAEELGKKKFCKMMRAIRNKNKDHSEFLKGQLLAYGWFAHSDNFLDQRDDLFQGEGLSES